MKEYIDIDPRRVISLLVTEQYCCCNVYTQSTSRHFQLFNVSPTLEKISPVSLERLFSSSTKEEKLLSSILWGIAKEHSSRRKIICQDENKNDIHSSLSNLQLWRKGYSEIKTWYYQLSENCGEDGAAKFVSNLSTGVFLQQAAKDNLNASQELIHIY